MRKLKVKSSKLKLKKGDKVRVMLGKDSGKEGTVEFVLARRGKVFVGGANIYKRHVRKMQNIEGGIIDLPKPIDVSNVALICPHCKKITRIGFKLEKNIKLRICRKCGKEIGEKK